MADVTHPTVEQLAESLYGQAAAAKQAAADASAHLRSKDRNGHPRPHVLAPWAAVRSPFRELWLARAQRELDATSTSYGEADRG